MSQTAPTVVYEVLRHFSFVGNENLPKLCFQTCLFERQIEIWNEVGVEREREREERERERKCDIKDWRLKDTENWVIRNCQKVRFKKIRSLPGQKKMTPLKRDLDDRLSD